MSQCAQEEWLQHRTTCFDDHMDVWALLISVASSSHSIPSLCLTFVMRKMFSGALLLLTAWPTQLNSAAMLLSQLTVSSVWRWTIDKISSYCSLDTSSSWDTSSSSMCRSRTPGHSRWTGGGTVRCVWWWGKHKLWGCWCFTCEQGSLAGLTLALELPALWGLLAKVSAQLPVLQETGQSFPRCTKQKKNVLQLDLCVLFYSTASRCWLWLCCYLSSSLPPLPRGCHQTPGSPPLQTHPARSCQSQRRSPAPPPTPHPAGSPSLGWGCRDRWCSPPPGRRCRSGRLSGGLCRAWCLSWRPGWHCAPPACQPCWRGGWRNPRCAQPRCQGRRGSGSPGCPLPRWKSPGGQSAWTLCGTSSPPTAWKVVETVVTEQALARSFKIQSYIVLPLQTFKY